MCSGGSKSIDAGNGVSLFVKERKEWSAFVRGFRLGERRLRREGLGRGQLHGGREGEKERGERESWRRRWGVEDGAKDAGQGPMWVVVKSGVERIKRGEA